jgi:secreted trypsin-like serine protease
MFIIVGRIDVNGYHTSDIVQVNKVVRPDNYNMNNIFDYNDIAIFELATPVEYEKGVFEYLSVTLTPPPVGTNLTVVGYGMLDSYVGTSLAHYGTINVAPDGACKFDSFRSEVSFCSDSEDVYSCAGDSGSPIITKVDGLDSYTLVGLDSYGHAGLCGEKQVDSVMSQVANMTQFIIDNTPLEPVQFVNITWAIPETTLPPGVTTTTARPTTARPTRKGETTTKPLSTTEKPKSNTPSIAGTSEATRSPSATSLSRNSGISIVPSLFILVLVTLVHLL